MPSDNDFSIAEKLGLLQGKLDAARELVAGLAEDVKGMDARLDEVDEGLRAVKAEVSRVEARVLAVEVQHGEASQSIHKIEGDFQRADESLRADLRAFGQALAPREPSDPNLRSNPNLRAVARSPSGTHAVVPDPEGSSSGDLAGELQALDHGADAAGKLAARITDRFKKHGPTFLLLAALVGAAVKWGGDHIRAVGVWLSTVGK